jgi:hypothetical protein
MDAMDNELRKYLSYEYCVGVLYNEYRPHTYLDGKTPQEVYEGLDPANTNVRFEPRSRWPRGSPCASPQTKVRGGAGAKFVLTITFMENRKHLPVVELRRVA